jgi:hypothetical protein
VVAGEVAIGVRDVATVSGAVIIRSIFDHYGLVRALLVKDLLLTVAGVLPAVAAAGWGVG